MGKTLSVRVRRRVAAIVAGVVAVAAPVAGQSSAAGPKPSTSSPAPRTADGHPDLQGVWFFWDIDTPPTTRQPGRANASH